MTSSMGAMAAANLPLSEEPLARGTTTGRVAAATELWREVADVRSAFEAAATTMSASAEVLCRLGETRLALGDLDGADASFRAAAVLDETQPYVQVGLGRVAEAQGRRDDAIAHLRRAVALHPGLEDIEALAEKLTGSRPAPSGKKGAGPATTDFAERFKFANELADHRRFADAEAIYRTLVEIRPTSPALLYKLGMALVEQDRIEEGAALYDRALAADPDFAWAHVGQGDLHEAAGRLPEALAAFERAHRARPDLSFMPKRLADLRRRLESQGTPGGPELLTWPATAPSTSGEDRRRVVVVAWDLSHNPVGRAWVLAELAARNAQCELVGPIFPAYGNDLWKPLLDTAREIEVHGFHAASFADFMNGALRLVVEHPCDVALVSKPRLPSLLIGLLYKAIHGARLVVDIDDDELAFVDAREPLDLAAFLADAQASDWRAPYGKRWTRLAVSMLGAADARTTCNPVLQKRFGGTVIRHSRDERLFDAAALQRDSLRREFGFSDDDRVILFLGTPRRHKGLISIAAGLQALDDSRAVLCIVGTIADEALKRDLLAMAPARIVFHPDQPFGRLAALNAMADVVCVLQDPASPIALSQTPAKLTDALATGTPVIATSVPPIQDLVGPGRITLIDEAMGEDALVERLREALAAIGSGTTAADERRAFFRQELSHAVNARRLATVIDGLFDREATPVPADLGILLRHIDREMPGRLTGDWERQGARLLGGGTRVGPLRDLDRDLNVVLFWKQNDSGLYGRRPDMLVQALSRLPRIGRILQIDAPICVDQLSVLAGPPDDGDRSPGRLIAAQVVKRFLEADDADGVHRRTFVYRGEETSLLGRELPLESAFPNAVQRWMADLGMTDNVLAWVCPVVPWFPEIQARLGFSFVLSDVIDDQRQWPMPALRRARIARSYHDVFALTDAATANNAALVEWLKAEGLPTRLVPNGMEVHAEAGSWPVPAEMQKLPRPIIGYAGSLTHRFDWPLLESIAVARPDWTILLIGAVPDTAKAASILARPNVRALGVMPYEQTLRHVAALDVAIVPHLRTSLSETMNPLKIYVYRSLGIPVVSTPVPSIEDFQDDIRTALPEHFVAEIEAALADRARMGRVFPADEYRHQWSWQTRLLHILEHVRAILEAQPRAVPTRAASAP
ncbi:glycosyltransferase [Reyranella sp.]|uniref:tetratricopeptide repeat-containing glycosyltransferase family protein n=1 Tax=Reyranella sp. TaxID=1929291 RepID=UPI003BA86A1D